MMHVALTNKMLRLVVDIELCRQRFAECQVPHAYAARIRNEASSRAADAVLRISHGTSAAGDGEEAQRYRKALSVRDARASEGNPLSLEGLSAMQEAATGESGSARMRGPKPAGVLEGVRDPESGRVEYIPPKAAEVEGLLDGLFSYLAESDDHPLVKAAVVHYMVATIHPFEDGNGRAALLACGFVLASSGFGFGGLAPFEETFAQDTASYRQHLQMGLPPLYYEGRNDPPHPEIWLEYHLANVAAFAHAALDAAMQAPGAKASGDAPRLKPREKAFYEHLLANGIAEYTPIEMAREFDVSNRTIINWSAGLASHGLVEPLLVKERIRSYRTVLPQS